MQAIASHQAPNRVLISSLLSYALKVDEKGGKVLATIIFPLLREMSEAIFLLLRVVDLGSWFDWRHSPQCRQVRRELLCLVQRSIVQAVSYELNFHRSYLSSTRSCSGFSIRYALDIA